jgi:O-antigen ligase
LVSLPFLANGIIQTESRGVILAAVVGGCAMYYLGNGKTRRVLMLAALLGLPVAIALAPPNFIDRLTNTLDAADTQTELDRSAAGRLDLIPAQFRMFMDHPFGTGHRGTAMLSFKYLDAENLVADETGATEGARASHNTILTVLVEQGAIGMAFFLGMLGWAAMTLRRLARESAPGLPPQFFHYVVAVGGSMAAVLTAGMFVDYLKAEIFYWCFALVAVLADISRRCHTTVTGTGIQDRTAADTSPRRRDRYGRPVAVAQDETSKAQ